MDKLIYFDNAASTKVIGEVLESMLPYFDSVYANPSSGHVAGTIARSRIEAARTNIAGILGADPKEIYFTSGGSESDNTAIRGIAYANKDKGKHIITSKIEHSAVLNTCRYLETLGFEVTYLNVKPNGIVDIDELKKSIRPDTILISIMHVNNEIGTIQPIYEIGKLARDRGIYFHTDAVQAFGNVRVDVKKQNIDALSLSSHKFYGPKGTGILYVKSNVKFIPLIYGGHQEMEKRAGTENVAGVVGTETAMKIASKDLDHNINHMYKLREYILDRLTKEKIRFKINGDKINRSPGNINISIPGTNNTEVIEKLSKEGVCISSTSACVTGRVKKSHVLSAIGCSYIDIASALRITIGSHNTIEEAKEFADILISVIGKMI